jgi:hypothetical protein
VPRLHPPPATTQRGCVTAPRTPVIKPTKAPPTTRERGFLTPPTSATPMTLSSAGSTTGNSLVVLAAVAAFGVTGDDVVAFLSQVELGVSGEAGGSAVRKGSVAGVVHRDRPVGVGRFDHRGDRAGVLPGLWVAGSDLDECGSPRIVEGFSMRLPGRGSRCPRSESDSSWRPSCADGRGCRTRSTSPARPPGPGGCPGSRVVTRLPTPAS